MVVEDYIQNMVINWALISVIMDYGYEIKKIKFHKSISYEKGKKSQKLLPLAIG